MSDKHISDLLSSGKPADRQQEGSQAMPYKDMVGSACG